VTAVTVKISPKRRHEELLLVVVPEREDRRRAQRGVGGHRDGVAGVELRQLLDHEDVGHVVEPHAAQLARDRHAEPSRLSHRLDVVPGELRPLVEVARHRLDSLVSESANRLLEAYVVV
jgi:hypothetical protein